MAKCGFKTRDGRPCGARATGSNGGCWNHDPQYELLRRRNARKGGQQGGRGRTNPGTIDLARIQSRFEALSNQVLQGEVDRGDAAVVAQLLNGARSCIVASAKIREVEEFEARLDALEEQLGVT